VKTLMIKKVLQPSRYPRIPLEREFTEFLEQRGTKRETIMILQSNLRRFLVEHSLEEFLRLNERNLPLNFRTPIRLYKSFLCSFFAHELAELIRNENRKP